MYEQILICFLKRGVLSLCELLSHGGVWGGETEGAPPHYLPYYTNRQMQPPDSQPVIKSLFLVDVNK